MDDLLAWLQDWYSGNCDGSWEHLYGVTVGTIDNPGWTMTINLEGTDLEGRVFQRLERDVTDDDWLRCWVEDNTFNGVGGPHNLSSILEVFRAWSIE